MRKSTVIVYMCDDVFIRMTSTESQTTVVVTEQMPTWGV